MILLLLAAEIQLTLSDSRATITPPRTGLQLLSFQFPGRALESSSSHQVSVIERNTTTAIHHLITYSLASYSLRMLELRLGKSLTSQCHLRLLYLILITSNGLGQDLPLNTLLSMDMT